VQYTLHLLVDPLFNSINSKIKPSQMDHRTPQKVRLVRHLVKINLMNISGVSCLIDLKRSKEEETVRQNESKVSAIVSISDRSTVVTSVPSRPLHIVSVEEAVTNYDQSHRDLLRRQDSMSTVSAFSADVSKSMTDFIGLTPSEDSQEVKTNHSVRYSHEASWIWLTDNDKQDPVIMEESDGSTVVIKVYLREKPHPDPNNVSHYQPGTHGFEPKFLHFTVGLVNETCEVIVVGSSKIVVDGKTPGVTMKLPIRPVEADEYAHAWALKRRNPRDRKRNKRNKNNRNTHKWDFFSLVQSSSWLSNLSLKDEYFAPPKKLSDGTIWRSFRNETIPGRMFGISSARVLIDKGSNKDSGESNILPQFNHMMSYLKKSYTNAVDRNSGGRSTCLNSASLTIKMVVKVPLRKNEPFTKCSAQPVSILQPNVSCQPIARPSRYKVVKDDSIQPKSSYTYENENEVKLIPLRKKYDSNLNRTNDACNDDASCRSDHVGNYVQFLPEKILENDCNGSITSSGSSDCNYDDDMSSCLPYNISDEGASPTSNQLSKLPSNLYVGMEESAVHHSRDSVSEYGSMVSNDSLTDRSDENSESDCSDIDSLQSQEDLENFFPDDRSNSSFEGYTGSNIFLSQFMCSRG